MTTIAFIGLGNMGRPMALNLIKAGHHLKIFDVVPGALNEVASKGGEVSRNAAAAVADADFVISMLPASVHVENLYLGANAGGTEDAKDSQGLLGSIPANAVIIDCSTIAPAASRKVHDRARELGLSMLDAPVSGGTQGAVDGTLTFMVGGVAEVLGRCRALFQVMGSNCFHAGVAGAGQVAKVCNNMLLAITMSGTAEALHLGVKNGLDPAVLSEIMRQSSGGNWPLSVYNPYPGVMPNVPAAKGYQGGFLVDLMLKDLGLANEAADSTGSAIPMGHLARNLYSLLRRDDEAGRKDFSSIQRLYGSTDNVDN